MFPRRPIRPTFFGRIWQLLFKLTHGQTSNEVVVVFEKFYAISSGANTRQNYEENMPVRLNCKIEDGFIPAEKIAYVQNADGSWEEITVSIKNLSDNKLVASEIGRKDDKVLVELPRESASGRWRVWVNQSSIGV